MIEKSALFILLITSRTEKNYSKNKNPTLARSLSAKLTFSVAELSISAQASFSSARAPADESNDASATATISRAAECRET